MRSVYIETSIPSYYFETRTTVLARAWREATRRWWEDERGSYHLVTSAFVVAELSEAPATKAAAALQLMARVEVLPEPPGLAGIIDEYVRHRLMPADAGGDAAHLAMCSMYGVDFLLTWNCEHLANANKVRHIQTVNQRLGLHIPILTTPLALIREES